MTKHMTQVEARKEIHNLVNALDVGLPNSTLVADTIYVLKNAARRLNYFGIQACNGVVGPDGYMKWDEEDQEKNDAACAKQEARVRKAIESLFDSETLARIEIEFQGDPRGPSFYIHEKNGRQRLATFW